MTVGRSGNTVILEIADTVDGPGATLTLSESFNRAFDSGIETIAFDDGTVWNEPILRDMWTASQLTDGQDDFVGFGASETIDGGLGDDRLNGVEGNDVYIWNRGDGSDQIVETRFDGAADRLLLQGVEVADVTVIRSGSSVLLDIADSVDGPGARLSLTESFNRAFDSGIETIEFDDGTIWREAELRALWTDSQLTDGDDNFTGFNASETFEGGAGDDRIFGSEGNDTYLWSHGDGSDQIDEDRFDGTGDRLELLTVTPDQVTVTNSGSTLILTIAESAPGADDGGVLRMTQTLNPSFDSGIETIAFADGTEWTQAIVRAQLLADAGTSGADLITGFTVADLIEGREGDDFLNGLEGDDLYIWQPGDGNDIIFEDRDDGTGDTLVLRGVLPEDVSLQRGAGDDLVVVVQPAGGGRAERITLRDSFEPTSARGIERILFEDVGVEWTQDGFAGQALVSGLDHWRRRDRGQPAGRPHPGARGQ